MNYKTIKTLFEKWCRRGWPRTNHETNSSDTVSVIFVSYNTIELTALLLFSIFRVLGRDKINRLVAVDNNSTDGSRELLKLFAAEGLIDLISNSSQNYHGPAVNQAIEFLAKQERRGRSARCTRYIWILDSDVIILKKDSLEDAIKRMKEQNAAAIGEFQYDTLAEGYAHISSLLIDPVKAWQRKITPFDNSGAPAARFQRSLRKHGLKVCDFPYRTDDYLLHLGRGTLKSIHQQGDKQNRFFQWATTHSVHHYHNNPNGEEIHRLFLEIFNRHVVSLTPEALLDACRITELLEILQPCRAQRSDISQT